MLPKTVIHADWSIHEGKRWMATALLSPDGRYTANVPRPVPPTSILPGEWARRAKDGGIVVGFDFPIGLPQRYARQVGAGRFREFLQVVGTPAWRDFFRVSVREADICHRRPFFPQAPGAAGEVSQAMLLTGLGVEAKRDLLRLCEQATGSRPAAECMFWTLGPRQVGKAMLSGWSEVLLPALLGPDKEVFRLWPFDGDLPSLAGPGSAVLLETYPGEMYGHFGVRGNNKTAQAWRREAGDRMLQWAGGAGVQVTAELRAQLKDGFGPRREEEDAFDAAVGLFGMLNVLLGHRDSGCPRDAGVRETEGWILGQRG